MDWNKEIQELKMDFTPYMESGIYCIINKINNKIYIGQSKNLLKRRKEHKKGLKFGTHHNDHLQKAYNNYGKENSLQNIFK